jgi:hypothetical protein
MTDMPIFPQLADIGHEHDIAVFRAMDACADVAGDVLLWGNPPTIAQQETAARIADEIRRRALERLREGHRGIARVMEHARGEVVGP